MWQLYGQDHVLRQLEASLKQGRLAHAYLLVGPPHVGKMTLALNLAQGVDCASGPGVPCGGCSQCTRIATGHHADVRVVGVIPSPAGEPTRTVIGIDDIKEVLHRTSLKPFEGACGVIIFDGAEAMSEEAANALLKTLEEPPPQVVLLLLTADEEALLPTIRSRCLRLQLRPMAKQQMAERLVAEHGADPPEAERLARLARGCLGWAISARSNPDVLAEREAELARMQEAWESRLEGRFSYASQLASLFFRDRESARQLLFLWLRWWRDLLLIKEGAEEYVHNSDRLAPLRLQATGLSTEQVLGFLKRLLQTLDALDRNANPRLALEVLMLDLPVSP